MKLVTAKEMREIDRKAIEELKISSLQLMEKAGRVVAKEALQVLNNISGKKVTIFAGRGNNGGDGLVAARGLLEAGIEVNVYLLGRKREVKGDADTNMKRWSGTVKEITEGKGLDGIKLELSGTDLVIDALLGTGTRGEIQGVLKTVIELINESDKPVLAVDIPSGLDADSGKLLSVCVKAATTVTMGLPKPGLVLYPGTDYAGELKVADIGIPDSLLSDETFKLNLVEEEDIVPLLPRRGRTSHKGDYGHVLVLAGSPGFTGAAVLTGSGALRAGSGLVTLGVAKSLNPVMEMKLTEVMTMPLPENAEGCLGLAAKTDIKRMSKKMDVLAVGPGLSTHPDTGELLKALLTDINKPMVIDADGLNLLVGDSISLLTKSSLSSIIITPHPGEMGRLLGKTAVEVQADRLDAARQTASLTRAIVVLKGARTVICDLEGNIFVNSTGNPGMASGGMGDILTGMIASFLGQGMSGIEAAKAGVYLHGLAGDMAAADFGEAGLIATDLLDKLPKAIKRLQDKKTVHSR